MSWRTYLRDHLPFVALFVGFALVTVAVVELDLRLSQGTLQWVNALYILLFATEFAATGPSFRTSPCELGLGAVLRPSAGGITAGESPSPWPDGPSNPVGTSHENASFRDRSGATESPSGELPT